MPLSPMPDPATRIAHGASAQVFALPGGQVLKLYHDAVSDEMIDREADVAALAHGLGLPAVAPLGRLRGANGRALLFPHIEGDTMMRVLRRQPWRTGALLKIMSATHRTIHAQHVAGLRPLAQVLRTDICYGPASPALQEAACSYLDRLPTGVSLLHGDFHVGNILLAQDRPSIIDWAKGTMGVPAADLVRTEMLMRFGQGGSDWLTNIWRDRSAAQLVRAYMRGGDVTAADLAAWRPVVALAWLRARAPVRDRAFLRYLNRSLSSAGLPRYPG